MAVDGSYSVHITYPSDFSDEARNQEWLDVATKRHQGWLDSGVLESFPAQQYATFPSLDTARAFVDELNKTGRWVVKTRP